MTEEKLKSLTNAKSYQRGYDLYLDGAISNTYLTGNQLIGRCDGNSLPYYDIEVELEKGEIGEAYCNCPYDSGDLCKHIVALLLTYIHDPEDFVKKPDTKELLSKLNRETLESLIIQLLEDDNNLYGVIQEKIEEEESKQGAKHPTEAKQPANKIKSKYRAEIREILHSLNGLRPSQAYWKMEGMVGSLDQLRKLACELLEYRKNEHALIILSLLFLETGKHCDQFDDSGGFLSAFLDELVIPLSEAILSNDLTSQEKERLTNDFEAVVYNLKSMGFSQFEVILAALEHGWKSGNVDGSKYDRSIDHILNQAKLNILEREGRTDEFIRLCLKMGEYHRYVLKKIEMGEYQDALGVALQKLKYSMEALEAALAFQENGQMDCALQIAERGLELEGEKDKLGTWLGFSEEKRGKREAAIHAYICAFIDSPSLRLYQKIKKLEPQNWNDEKQHLLQTAQSSYSSTDVLIDIYLFEEEWDHVIETLDKYGAWNVSLTEKAVDAMVAVRPEWVIAVSRRHAEELIGRSQGKYYEMAADWLEKMKQAYASLDKEVEWQTYLEGLKIKYRRRPSLQAELGKL